MSNYPLSKFHFLVEWGGTKIGFSEIKGLEMEYEIIEYHDGSSPEYSTKKMPGTIIYSDITLTRALYPGDNEFFEWFNTVNLNQVERRDILISLLNEEHAPIVVWKFKNCFPRKYIGPELNTLSGEPAKESLVLAHEGMRVEYP